MRFECGAGFFGGPVGGAIETPFPMRGEKAAAVAPVEGPDDVAIGLRNVEGGDFVAGIKVKGALAMFGRAFIEALLDLEQENEPMGLARIGVLAHDAGEVQVVGVDFQAEFFVGFAARGRIRRLSLFDVDFAAARAPETFVRLLCAFDEQDFVATVETIKQRRNFVGKAEGGSIHISRQSVT